MLNKILNFLFPEKCSWCWKYWDNLCKNCLKNFLEREKKFFNLEKNFSSDEKNFLFEKIYSPFFYHKNSILKKILKEIKYKNKFSKFSGLEEKIFLEFKKFFDFTFSSKTENIYLIPTPLHWKKQLKRWFNQSEIFCNKIEERWLEENFNQKNIKKLNLIKKIKNTKSQAESTKTERLKNLTWAFEINKKYLNLKSDKNIFILIDDVLSTWETMKNCAIEIKKHFPEWKVFWFVICSDKNL